MGSTRRGNILNPNPRAYVRTVAGKTPDPISGDVSLQQADVAGLGAALSARELIANKDQPGGYVGIQTDGHADGRWQIMGGTAAEINATVPFLYEIVYVAGEGLRVGDGVTAGGQKVTGLRVAVQDFSASATGTYYLDHQNADVLIVKCYATDAARTFTFAGTTAGDPLVHDVYGALSTQGITSGATYGQRLSIQFDLRATSSDGSAGNFRAVLSGLRFGWNSDVARFQGTASRSVATEPNVGALPGVFHCAQVVELWWDGTFWQEVTPVDRLANVVKEYGAAFGWGNQAGTYSLSAGRQLNANSNVSFSATFGDQNRSMGNYALTGGFGTSGPTSGTYAIHWGNAIQYGAQTWSEAHVLVRGRLMRARWPMAHTVGHSFGTLNYGACQTATYQFSGNTVGAVSVDLVPGGGSGGSFNATTATLTIPPKTVIAAYYHVVAYNATSPGGAHFAGHFCIMRDAANNTLFVTNPTEFVRGATGTCNGCDCAVTVDDVNERLKITVTGLGGQTIRWTASVRTAEAADGPA